MGVVVGPVCEVLGAGRALEGPLTSVHALVSLKKNVINKNNADFVLEGVVRPISGMLFRV